MAITEVRADSSESNRLLLGAQEGDADAYCALMEVCETRLFRQAVALCHDCSWAEDLVAETLVEGWKSIRRFDGRCRLSTWLYAILIHRYQKSLRKARSRPVPFASLAGGETAAPERLLMNLPDSNPLPPEVLIDRERAKQLREAVHALPLTHQQVVLLRFYEGASLLEVASALALSPGTVKSRLHYALQKLRRMDSLMNLLKRTGDTRT